MADFKSRSRETIQGQERSYLTDAFLPDLVKELDHEDIVGITLGGSYARGNATMYSDVDIACFWREGQTPPPKRFFYREDRLISVKMTSVAEFRAMLKRPQAVILFVGDKHQILLDKDGSIAQLMKEIEAFRWEDLQSETDASISTWMMLKAEDIQKVLREFQQNNMPGLAYAISKLVSEMTLLTALNYKIFIINDSNYYRQVEEAAGLDSAWTRWHRIATGIVPGPMGIDPLRARGITVLRLYHETFAITKSAMQPDHRAVVEHVLRIVEEATKELSFTSEEKQLLKQ